MRLRQQRIVLLLFLLVTMAVILLKQVGIGVRTKSLTCNNRSSSSDMLPCNPRSNRITKSENNFKMATKPSVHVLTRGGDGRWVERTGMCDVRHEFVRAHLKEPANTTIFVYDRASDIFVSESIISKGMWEGDLVNQTRDFLKEDPERVFLDLGSNVGVFSLMAAKIGHQVVSVDLLSGNVQRLCASSIEGHFSDRVTIIHNALSDIRGNVTFRLYKGNVGGTSVKTLDSNQKTKNENIITAILLDDLLEIFKFQKVVIKMDLETFEEKVLKGGEKFFTKVRVDYLLMEFEYHRTRPSGRSIIAMLDRHGMIPMLPSVRDVRNLSDSDIKAWPGYVTWKRKI
ncbi:uncharacterized protein LOC117331481 [Pecten maximus]|uniref:uncharacterized protein LOC117331481 n=1 Tax=Pecten maximus TaxID=6579 RepID=UPI001458EC79|nr:uncharacterized protein LOC117331481 [Pecten maximus]